MDRFYDKLTARYDKDIVDAVLAVSCKKGGEIPEGAFMPEVFANAMARCCSAEYLAEIESIIAYYDSLPDAKSQKLGALAEALREA